MMEMMGFGADRFVTVIPFVFGQIIVTILWAAAIIWAVIDVARCKKKDTLTKIFWLLVITVLGNLRYSWIGVIIYYFFGREKKKK